MTMTLFFLFFFSPLLIGGCDLHLVLDHRQGWAPRAADGCGPWHVGFLRAPRVLLRGKKIKKEKKKEKTRKRRVLRGNNKRETTLVLTPPLLFLFVFVCLFSQATISSWRTRAFRARRPSRCLLSLATSPSSPSASVPFLGSARRHLFLKHF